MAKVDVHLTIDEEHKAEADDRNLNLSGFLRDRLEEWSERDGDGGRGRSGWD
jgi:hypothetical protein